MGNSKKGLKPRSKNQPSKLLLSGDSTVMAVGGGKSGGSVSDTTINIQLIQIELGVAAQVQVGDFVQLHWRDTHYEVYFDSQRLGNVPGTYNKALLPPSGHSGNLVKVAIYADPIVMIVQVRLPTEQL